MKERITEAINSIIAFKESAGEAFPCAHSVEVANKLKMNALDVEVIANDIEGVICHRTINGAYYETKPRTYPYSVTRRARSRSSDLETSQQD
jgi:hypothetical protein